MSFKPRRGAGGAGDSAGFDSEGGGGGGASAGGGAATGGVVGALRAGIVSFGRGASGAGAGSGVGVGATGIGGGVAGAVWMGTVNLGRGVSGAGGGGGATGGGGTSTGATAAAGGAGFLFSASARADFFPGNGMGLLAGRAGGASPTETAGATLLWVAAASLWSNALVSSLGAVDGGRALRLRERTSHILIPANIATNATPT